MNANVTFGVCDVAFPLAKRKSIFARSSAVAWFSLAVVTSNAGCSSPDVPENGAYATTSYSPEPNTQISSAFPPFAAKRPLPLYL